MLMKLVEDVRNTIDFAIERETKLVNKCVIA